MAKAILAICCIRPLEMFNFINLCCLFPVEKFPTSARSLLLKLSDFFIIVGVGSVVALRAALIGIASRSRATSWSLYCSSQ